MSSGPPPPADLYSRDLPLTKLSAGTELVRVWKRDQTPAYYDFGAGSRFNAPSGEFGVMYVAQRPHGAFAETLLRNVGATVLQQSDINARNFAAFPLKREFRAAMLCGNGLCQLGATAEVTSNSRYDTSQQWALALWSHPDRPDGIAYMSRHDDHEWCYAIFDRASSAFASPRCWRMGDDPNLLRDILDHYNVALV